MLGISTAQGNSETTASEIDVIDAIRAACARELSPLVQKIDKEGLYPESVMRELGRLGAFAHHLPDGSDDVRLGIAINAMAAAGNTACRHRSAFGVRTHSPGTSSHPIMNR